MIFVNIAITLRQTIKARSKSFVSSSPLNALARYINVLGLFLSRLQIRASCQGSPEQAQ
jgi:hypothetical protein